MREALLYDGLEYWRREAPDKTALVLDNSDTLTYSELGRWSDGVAAKLQDLGVRPGDNVSVSGANSIEWVVAAFAAVKAGATLVPLNERFVRNEFAHLIESTEPRAIIADAERAEKIAGIREGTAILRMEDLPSFKTMAPSGWKPVRVASDHLAMIIYTSGSTGKPKGVMISHERVIAQYMELRLVEPSVGPDMRQLMVMSLQAGPGTMHGYFFVTTHGGMFCFLRRFEPNLALQTLVDRKVTWFANFPVILEQIRRLPAFETADLSSLKCASCGGARLSQEALAAYRNKGVLLRQMYGQTEVIGYAILGTTAEARQGKWSCGRPMPFTKIRVVRPDGSDCAPGEAGQIIVKGPSTLVGYWRNPEATAQTIIDGWVQTGDQGVFDKEGYLTYVDRMKDIIKTGGFNVSPSEIESVISHIPQVIEVAVIAVADEKYGETPAALVYADPPIPNERIFAHCRENLAGFKQPRYVVPLDGPLPRLPSGKVNKMQLRVDYADVPQRFRTAG
ncbi:MAG: AMP-binding protein [Hydrogenophilaceae bacterium]|jgi:fatty-acyl-CoA synthase|nr:AMP-binding protein [Hydrogenophilaceae bacterium]